MDLPDVVILHALMHITFVSDSGEPIGQSVKAALRCERVPDTEYYRFVLPDNLDNVTAQLVDIYTTEPPELMQNDRVTITHAPPIAANPALRYAIRFVP